MTVHIVEPGGRGGVFQHALAVAAALADARFAVTLHTAADAEISELDGIRFCGCVDWKRELRHGYKRNGSIVVAYLRSTVSHLRESVRHGDIVHVQGLFGQALTTLTLAAARRTPARVVHSPHNTFSRRGRRFDEALLRSDIRIAHATIVFSEADRTRLTAWGHDVIVSPLAQYMPSADSLPTALWRQRWASPEGRPTVLFAGQVRPDKRLDLLLAAATVRRDSWQLAVVGEDKGDVARCRKLAQSLDVSVLWYTRYVDLDEFVGALAAADVIACPHAQASQSGVLAVACQLGVPAVASRVGGLAELATLTFTPGDAADLARMIDRALAHGRLPPQDQRAELLEAHLAAYGVAA